MLKCENIPRTNSTKYVTQNILVKFQQNEHTPGMHSCSPNKADITHCFLPFKPIEYFIYLPIHSHPLYRILHETNFVLFLSSLQKYKVSPNYISELQ